jgi:hypothetical protein
LKALITALALGFAVLVAQAAGDKPDAKPVAAAASGGQQSKMKQCNADAKGKKGDERKAFMKECLSKKG